MAEIDFEIKVGEKVVLIENGHNSGMYNARKGIPPNYYEATISKVGRKYFYVSRIGRSMVYKFNISTGTQVTSGSCYDVSVRKDWGTYLEEITLAKDCQEFNSKYFSGYIFKTTREKLDKLIAIMEG